MSTSHTILIRADVGPNVGTGHVMRTAALATAWGEMGGAATMVCGPQLPGSLRHRLEKTGLKIETIAANSMTDDADQTRELAEQLGARWLVIDGYGFDDEYQQAIKSSEFKLMVIDDFGHARHKLADMVLNQNIYSVPSKYREASPEFLLLGPSFVLMRDEFNKVAVNKKRIPKIAKRILITMGGADQENFTATCLRAIAELSNSSDISVDAVVGASNPNFESLKQLCREVSLTVRLHQNTDRMAALIDQCDVAVTAGGSTCYELARSGVPGIVVSTTENQVPVARSFHEHGGMIWLGDSNSLPVEMLTDEIQKIVNDSSLRKQMAEANSNLVDGQGAQRVARRLFQEELIFRAANESDSRQIWQWRNDPDVRESSIQTQEISWEQHQDWYQNTLSDHLVDIWIVESRAGQSIGPVRFNFDSMGSEATISISLAPEFRGRGWGTAVIEAACRQAFLSDDIQEVIAWIKPDNKGSQAAFQKAGFTIANETNPSGFSIHKDENPQALKFVLRREQFVVEWSADKTIDSARKTRRSKSA